MLQPRRTLLRGLWAALPLSIGASLRVDGLAVSAEPGPRRLRIAAVTSVYKKDSHSQLIVDRFLEGYGWRGKHYRPSMDVVGLYVEQLDSDDLSGERLKRHPELKRYPTIPEALTLNTGSLAVDGVLLIVDSVRDPQSKIGPTDSNQAVDARSRYFQQVAEVFRAAGRSVPVFLNQHLPWNWDDARQMVQTASDLSCPFMVGSSLPVTWRIPSVDLPWQAEVIEAVGVCGDEPPGDGRTGSGQIIEGLQCLLERRRGGETGVDWVEALRGDRFWQANDVGTWDQGGWDSELLHAALARSHQLTPSRPTYNNIFPTRDEMERMSPDAYVYRWVYRDGTRASVIGLPGVVGDGNVALRLKSDEVLSLQFYLPQRQLRNSFSPLVHHIETLFSTRELPYPVERGLLTAGIGEAGIKSWRNQQDRIDTPHLDVNYRPAEESLFWSS